MISYELENGRPISHMFCSILMRSPKFDPQEYVLNGIVVGVVFNIMIIYNIFHVCEIHPM